MCKVIIITNKVNRDIRQSNKQKLPEKHESRHKLSNFFFCNGVHLVIYYAPAPNSTGVGSGGGVCRDLTPNYLCGRY